MNANLAGFITVLMWSVSSLLIIGAGHTPPFLMGFMTLSVASILLFSKSILIDKNTIKDIVKQPISAYFLTFFGIGGYTCFWFLAFAHAPAFEANTLNYLWPILLVTFSMILKRERFSVFRILGLLLGFAGVILLFLQKEDPSAAGDFLNGYIFAILGAIIWAAYSNATHYIKFSQNAMAIFMLLPALFFLILHLQYEEFYTPTKFEFLFLFLLGATRISFSFWDYAMKNGSVLFLGSISYFIPIISSILLIIFGFMPRNETILLSCALVLSGCLIANGRAIIKIISKKKKTNEKI